MSGPKAKLDRLPARSLPVRTPGARIIGEHTLVTGQ